MIDLSAKYDRPLAQLIDAHSHALASLDKNEKLPRCRSAGSEGFIDYLGLQGVCPGWNFVGGGAMRAVYRYRSAPFVVKLPGSAGALFRRVNLSEAAIYRRSNNRTRKYLAETVVISRALGITAQEYIRWDCNSSGAPDWFYDFVCDQGIDLEHPYAYGHYDRMGPGDPDYKPIRELHTAFKALEKAGAIGFDDIHEGNLFWDGSQPKIIDFPRRDLHDVCLHYDFYSGQFDLNSYDDDGSAGCNCTMCRNRYNSSSWE